MRRPQPRGHIRPKISTMPRQKTEAAAFLDIYKLVVEKKRLEQELDSLDERRQILSDRLTVLDQHITALEGSVQTLREQGDRPASSSPLPPTTPQRPTYETFLLDY
ncbi:hypothetical protein ACQ4M4_21570 [Leptolyngbya sp. AN02str]|uniref:hypothetical protein n=1 Tax=Leptolyngbya sp. AN02str TaxID=3423363 RepID=UPI003D310F82